MDPREAVREDDMRSSMAMPGRARETSPIDLATRHLSERVDLLHKRLDELGQLMLPYCRPDELRADDAEKMIPDRDVASNYREGLDIIADRVQAANQRIDDLIAHAEL